MMPASGVSPPLWFDGPSIRQAGGKVRGKPIAVFQPQGAGKWIFNELCCNCSNDANNSNIVIFQKNVATDFDELVIAWKVIRNCGQGDNHPFKFPMTISVSASDSYGNYMP